jgi:uncharacterized protein
MAGLNLGGLVLREPRPGVGYADVLTIKDDRMRSWGPVALGIGGAMLGLVTVLLVPSLVNGMLLRLFYAMSGSPGSWADYLVAGSTFAIPAGMAATQLGLATMILIAAGLMLFIHRFHPRWLNSVQPGFRWRYAFGATLIAVVILGGLWALSRIGQPWVVSPEPQLWLFLVVIVLTSPLQAAGEEYFFRGYLLQALQSTAARPPVQVEGEPNLMSKTGLWLSGQYGRWAGVIGSALIFALFHGGQNAPLFLHRFAFGLIAGVLVLKTGGLEAGIAAHVINNVVAFGYAALSGTMVATKTVSEASWPELVWNLVGFGVFAVAAIWLAKRMKLATTTPASRFGE